MGQLGGSLERIFFVFVLSSDTDRFICRKFVGCSFLNMHAPIIPIAQLEKGFGAL